MSTKNTESKAAAAAANMKRDAFPKASQRSNYRNKKAPWNAGHGYVGGYTLMQIDAASDCKCSEAK